MAETEKKMNQLNEEVAEVEKAKVVGGKLCSLEDALSEMKRLDIKAR